MRRLLLVLVLMGLALPAWASHVDDGGVDEAWVNAMNQESYWEDRFGADCAKFDNHLGVIPEQYDAAVIKDGNMVRVYANVGGAFTALGAVNPANGQHFGAPHSWVMKCTIEPLPPVVSVECLTVTIDAAEGVEWAIQIGDGFVEGEGTDAFTGSAGQSWAVYYQGQAIASGVFESCTTTTTQPEVTSSTIPPETTTSLPDQSTTTPDSSTSAPTTSPTTSPLAPTTTAQESSTLETLPFTGPSDWLPLGFVALSLASLGGLLVWSARRREG